MKKVLLPFCILFGLMLLSSSSILAQADLVSFTRANDSRIAFEEDLAPFYHGVASGDPTQNSVIIWTRISLDQANETESVAWFVATDTSFTNIVAQGETSTSAEKDYTIKVDVTDLEAGTTYYYAFQHNGTNSIAGRTRTASDDADHLRFAIVSCSNYQHGFFNAYKRISERNDLDAVLHLGDYIYEYGENTAEIRPEMMPDHEILELIDYRTRYSFYRLDEDLRKLHQQHPIICVWDDHEVANDSYIDGAQNHQEGEGDYQERKSKAHQAYFEWMPIRDREDNAKKVYRKISYGNLVDLFMIDTRHEARMQQIEDIEDPTFYDENRTLLGEEQKAWLLDGLNESDAHWKLIGNQVLFTPFAYEQFVGAVGDLVVQLVADIWQGYPVERNQIINHIAENNIDNVIVLTGDIHATFASDIPADPENLENYNPQTGEGSTLVEFVTPSVSSNNYDEYLDASAAQSLQNLIASTNPQVKASNLTEHGYFVLDLLYDRAQADWFYDPDRNTPSDTETHALSYFTINGLNRLIPIEEASTNKATQETPAPNAAPNIDLVGLENFNAPPNNNKLFIVSIYQNSADQSLQVNFALNERQRIQLQLLDSTGKILHTQANQLQAGLFSERIQLNEQYPSGTYILQISGQKGSTAKQFIIH